MSECSSCVTLRNQLSAYSEEKRCFLGKVKELRSQLDDAEKALQNKGVSAAGITYFQTKFDEMDRALCERNRELAEAQREAVNLATSLWSEHFREESPGWEPLNTVPGVISQISNMVTIIRDIKAERDAALERVKSLEEVLADVCREDLFILAASTLELTIRTTGMPMEIVTQHEDGSRTKVTSIEVIQSYIRIMERRMKKARTALAQEGGE